MGIIESIVTSVIILIFLDYLFLDGLFSEAIADRIRGKQCDCKCKCDKEVDK